MSLFLALLGVSTWTCELDECVSEAPFCAEATNLPAAEPVLVVESVAPVCFRYPKPCSKAMGEQLHLLHVVFLLLLRVELLLLGDPGNS